MSILNRLRVSTVLVATFLMGQTVWAATYYVDRNLLGNDANSGLAETAPLFTIQAALDKASSPGDTVYVKNGTYTEKIWVKYGGTAGNLITISNYPGHSPRIQMAAYVPSGFRGTGGDTRLRFFISNIAGSQTPLQYLLIQGFEITSGFDGMKFDALGNSTIRKMHIHDTYGNGIIGFGSNVTLDSNKFERVGIEYAVYAQAQGLNLNQVHGMYLTGQNYVIINNIFSDTPAGYGLHLAGYVQADQPGTSLPSSYYGYTGTVANNTFAYGRNNSGIVVYMPAAVNSTIENNIFYENNQTHYFSTPNGVQFYDCGAGHLVRNNIFYATTPGSTDAFTDNRGGRYTASNNQTNVANPAFADGPPSVPTSPNFSLQSGSPAIDKGLIQSFIKFDFAGSPRPQGSGYDIGAYENGSSSSNAPPNAPQGLLVH